jgi:hypothetical protein
MLSLRFNTVTDEGQVYASTKMHKEHFLQNGKESFKKC